MFIIADFDTHDGAIIGPVIAAVFGSIIGSDGLSIRRTIDESITSFDITISVTIVVAVNVEHIGSIVRKCVW